MTKTISLDVSDEIYSKLVSLSDWRNQDIKEGIACILGGVSRYAPEIMTLNIRYGERWGLDRLVSRVIFAGCESLRKLFDSILKTLEAEGLFLLDHFDVDLDMNSSHFTYAAHVDCKLLIDTFYLDIELGGSELRTYTTIEIEKVPSKALEKLKVVVGETEMPEEFDELEAFYIQLDEDDEFWNLIVIYEAESFGYLPPVKQV